MANLVERKQGNAELAIHSGGILTLDDGSSALTVQRTKYASVARTDVAAKDLFVLPAGAIPVAVSVYSPTASNAGTTATLSVGLKGGTGTEWLNGLDVKTAGTGAGQTHPAVVAGVLFTSVGASNITLTGIYAETGAASNAGGPWTVAVEYVL